MTRARTKTLGLILVLLATPAYAHGIPAQLVFLLTAFIYVLPGVLIWCTFHVCNRVTNSPHPVENAGRCGRMVVAAWLPYGFLWLGWLAEIPIGRLWFVTPLVVLIPAFIELSNFRHFMQLKYPPAHPAGPGSEPGPPPSGMVRCPGCGTSNYVDSAKCIKCKLSIQPGGEQE